MSVLTFSCVVSADDCALATEGMNHSVDFKGCAFDFLTDNSLCKEGSADCSEEMAARIMASAKQGRASSYLYLGRFYILGHGVDYDAAEAIKWYLKAIDEGVEGAEADYVSIMSGAVSPRALGMKHYKVFDTPYMVVETDTPHWESIEGTSLAVRADSVVSDYSPTFGRAFSLRNNGTTPVAVTILPTEWIQYVEGNEANLDFYTADRPGKMPDFFVVAQDEPQPRDYSVAPDSAYVIAPEKEMYLYFSNPHILYPSETYALPLGIDYSTDPDDPKNDNVQYLVFPAPISKMFPYKAERSSDNDLPTFRCSQPEVSPNEDNILEVKIMATTSGKRWRSLMIDPEESYFATSDLSRKVGESCQKTPVNGDDLDKALFEEDNTLEVSPSTDTTWIYSGEMSEMPENVALVLAWRYKYDPSQTLHRSIFRNLPVSPKQ